MSQRIEKTSTFEQADAFLNISVVGKNGEKRLPKGIPLYADKGLGKVICKAMTDNPDTVIKVTSQFNWATNDTVSDFEL